MPEEHQVLGDPKVKVISNVGAHSDKEGIVKCIRMGEFDRSWKLIEFGPDDQAWIRTEYLIDID